MDSFDKRPQLTKDQRISRLFKDTEKILKEVKSCKGSLNTVLHKSRHRGCYLKRITFLCHNVLKYRYLLERVIADVGLLEKEPFIRAELASILIYELVLGKGLNDNSKPVNIIRNYESKIRQAFENAKKADNLVQNICSLPRYARVNHILTTVGNVMKDLRKSNFFEVRYDSSITEEEYLDLVRNLEKGQFMIDYHFKDLLVFSSKERVIDMKIFAKNHIVVHDKSSYIPVHVLDPQRGCTVLDACAAPGMKTTHIASRMKNEGKIFAYEKDSERFKLLEKMLKSTGVTITEAECADFYEVKTNDSKFSNLKYILLDPSCSGSGMVKRMDDVTDTADSKNASRLQKLGGFQMLLLKHALSFPNVERVVYSTCSLYEEENENVIQEVLATFGKLFKLVSVLPEWSVRGSDAYDFGKLCLRAYPDKTLTNGFFVAMFERKSYDEIQEGEETNVLPKRKLKKVKGKAKDYKEVDADSEGNHQYENEVDVRSNDRVEMGDLGNESLDENCGKDTVISEEKDFNEYQDEEQTNNISKKKLKKMKRKAKEGKEVDPNCEGNPQFEMDVPANGAQEQTNNISKKKLKKMKRKAKEGKEVDPNCEGNPQFEMDVPANGAQEQTNNISKKNRISV